MKKEINHEEHKGIHKVESFVHLCDELGVPLW
jgi:hypothetical protein